MVSVSVVVPTYNREKTIRYCLESVLSQTYPPSEIIVVDDCSVDGTVKVVEEIGDSRIRCIMQPRNNGAQAARNRGIKEARGEWIAFQDSDDAWVPEKLERQVDALSRVDFAPFTVVHTNCWRYEACSGRRTLCKVPPVNGAKCFQQMLYSSGPMLQGLLTSKLALEKIGFLDESVPSYQEWDAFIRLARECTFIHITEPLFIYHFHAGETISKDKHKDIMGYQYIVDKFRDEIVQQCGTNVLNDHIFFNALRAMCLGYCAEASEILSKSSGTSVRINFLNWMLQKKIKSKNCERIIGIIHLTHRMLRRKAKST